MTTNKWFNRLVISYIIVSAPILIMSLFLSGVSIYKSYQAEGFINRAAESVKVDYENVKLNGHHPRFVDGYQACMDDKRYMPVFKEHYKTYNQWIIDDYFEKKMCDTK